MKIWFEAAKENNSNQIILKMWLLVSKSRIMAVIGVNYRYLGRNSHFKGVR